MFKYVKLMTQQNHIEIGVFYVV